MSLVGSLEDLGLGEILQIISLSRKSGILKLCSEEGEGHIVFRDGEIRGASLKGEPADLAEMLVRRGAVPKDEVDRLVGHAHDHGELFEDLVIRHGVISGERLDGLRLESVESAVLRMFRWVAGEFSFEVHAGQGAEPHPGGLTLTQGLNPQFLALEGTRLQDELSCGGGPEPEAELLFDGDDPEADFSELADVGGEALDEHEAVVDALPTQLLERPEAAILVEPDLGCLEVTKGLLAESFARVHAFQRPDLGIERIRQYLARRELPLVLLSDRTPSDSLTGARDWRQILARLKVLAPRMPVLLLAEGGVPQPAHDLALDGVLPRPSRGSHGLVEQLDELMPPRQGTLAPSTTDEALSAADLERLGDAKARLEDPDDSTGVIPLVLRFAAEQFARVAIFMVRDDQAVGMAQAGLQGAGGPDDAGLREVSVPVAETGWFRRAATSGEPACAPPCDHGDQQLAVLLGNAVPTEAYVGPIHSGGRVVALLYADQLPREALLGDVRALDAVLREAGAALDRALLRHAAASGEV